MTTLRATLLFIILSFTIRHSAPAAIIYSGLQHIPIPTDFDGVYLDIDTGAHSSSTILGWDVNLFFGGLGLGGNTPFQPARVGTGNMDTVLRYALNDYIDGSLLYSTGETGSSDHLGAPGNFQDGVEGYLGFKFSTNSNSGPYYGWMRLTLTANTAGAFIHDWAWDTTGAGVFVGVLVPEPGRTTLVLAAAMIVLFRRRRIPSASSPAAAPPRSARHATRDKIAAVKAVATCPAAVQ